MGGGCLVSLVPGPQIWHYGVVKNCPVVEQYCGAGVRVTVISCIPFYPDQDTHLIDSMDRTSDPTDKNHLSLRRRIRTGADYHPISVHYSTVQ